jgi:hypothetical protein
MGAVTERPLSNATLERYNPAGSFFFRCLSKRESSSGRPLCFGGGSI